MIVTLIGKNTIYKTKLPQTIEGNYWIIGENDKKIINIEGSDNGWTIESNNNIKILKPQEVKSFKVAKTASFPQNIIGKIILKEYSFNYLYIKDISDELLVLYCSPTYEDKFTHLDIKTSKEILIGRATNSDIFYENALIKPKHARIFFSNGKLMLENFDDNFGTFVNERPVTKKLRLLFNGDVIFIMGLKIIIIGRSIFINNPFNRVRYDERIFREKKIDLPKLEELNDEESEEELYSEKDYFARAPRIRNKIEREKIKIDRPPENQNKEGMPLIYMIGSTATMGIVMLISTISTISGISGENATFKDIFFPLFTSIAMVICMILFPTLSSKYEKKKKAENEKTRQTRYRKYINSKIELIDKTMEKQRKILYENYMSAEECVKTIINKGARLWERKIEDVDFLKIRIGIGDVPLEADIQYPEMGFTMEDDNLMDILNTIVDKSKILKDVPITIPLAEKNIAGLIIKDNDRLVEKFVQNVIVQLVALHSYEDLKLVFLLKEDKDKKWEHFKTLPHIWDSSKQIRFWAEDYNDMKEISKYLETDFLNRLQKDERHDYKSFKPYYLIITDDYKKIENLKIITEILKQKRNIGFGIFCITNNLLNLPNECKAFINLENNEGTMFEDEMAESGKKDFFFDPSYTFFMERIGKQLSNIPIKFSGASNLSLPESYTFLEMYDVGKVEQLNILERWKASNATMSLQAPLGVDSAGMPISLDIHEKFHGPHGLIAGGTGSGKSELIITYILSLAINYSPDDVTMILIDYKGGGLAGAFQKNDVKLPHLVGTITNIDTVGLQRSLASIQSELRRRQILFNEARDKIDEGTIDIYKYQRLYHDGVVSQPIPHLLIICDEFAELKQQQNEFMDELISVARIGRSLGVHLILATQKPAGIVNDQIRSNSKFGICLKVQDVQDSMDVIKRPDAAYLKKAGQFYLQVGNNEYFTIGQSAWTGAPYIPADVIKKTVDSSIRFVSNTGSIIKTVDTQKKQKVNKNGEQLTNIVKYIYEVAKKENIKTKQLWLENVPEIIYIDQLKKKYKITKDEEIIKSVIGEYDDPFNQRQGIVEVNFQNQGNIAIYGNAESGKETLLSTIVYDIMTTYTADKIQMYLLDFGSEALKIFKESPLVGDVVFANNHEKITRLFEMLQKKIKERTKILSDYGGDYNLYIKTTGNAMPLILVIINNYEAFAENYRDEYDDTLLTLTREGLKYGIVFTITVSSYNDLRYRLSQNFRQKIALQLNNEDDYLNILEGVGKKRPSHIFGRGLVKIDNIYEFQTARICEPERWNSYIKEVCTELKENNPITAEPIPTLPDKVTFEDVKEAFKDITTVPIGMDKKTLTTATYDFSKNLVNIITSKNIDNIMQFIPHMLEEIKMLENINILIFDAERIIQTGKTNINLNYQNLRLEMKNNLRKNKQTICIIIGVDKFLNDIDNNENGFFEMLKDAQELKNYNFIIIDNFTKLKNREYDQWYKNYVSNDSGIWIGNGLNDQYLINVSSASKDIVNNCGNNFGYIINREIPKLVKLLGMKDKDDENG